MGHLNRKKFFLLLCIVFFPAMVTKLWFLAPVYFPKESGVASWGAPIVWAGSFDPQQEELHWHRGTVIGLSVFAVGKYIQRYLRHFLETAEVHFMVGHPVIYYVMVDNVSLVPKLRLAPNRTMVVTQVTKHARWQDISMMRMRDILDLVVPRAQREVNYLFCMDVDQEFTSRYGAEALGDLVAQLHSSFYIWHRFFFSYETNPSSAAYVSSSEGDYYYHAATFGGTVPQIFNLTRACLEGIQQDKANGLEAVWHDESHLNRYLIHRKPTKLLSPEYSWDGLLNVRHSRMRWMPKDYSHLRGNPT